MLHYRQIVIPKHSMNMLRLGQQMVRHRCKAIKIFENPERGHLSPRVEIGPRTSLSACGLCQNVAMFFAFSVILVHFITLSYCVAVSYDGFNGAEHPRNTTGTLPEHLGEDSVFTIHKPRKQGVGNVWNAGTPGSGIT